MAIIDDIEKVLYSKQKEAEYRIKAKGAEFTLEEAVKMGVSGSVKKLEPISVKDELSNIIWGKVRISVTDLQRLVETTDKVVKFIYDNSVPQTKERIKSVFPEIEKMK